MLYKKRKKYEFTMKNKLSFPISLPKAAQECVPYS